MLCAAAVCVGRAAPAWAQPEASTFVAHYAADVPSSARAAVDAALHIWEQRLVSSVPIDVDVQWGGGLPSGVAAATEPTAYAPVADGSLQPAALANALAGRDLDPDADDIRLVLGRGIRWYTGTDGAAPANATDMETLALHELAHGLGFAQSFRLADGGLVWGRGGVAVGLDAHVVDASTGALVDAPSAAERLSAATSRRIVWRGSARDSRGRAPVMYAPGVYEPGSSLSHFDEDAYPQGDPDSLMTSLIRRGEVIHRIGPAALGVLHDLGWTVRAEPLMAPVASAPAVTSSTSTTIVAAPVVTVPAPPVRTAAAVGDFGAARGAEAGAAVPALFIGVLWRALRRRRVMRDGPASVQHVPR